MIGALIAWVVFATIYALLMMIIIGVVTADMTDDQFEQYLINLERHIAAGPIHIGGTIL